MDKIVKILEKIHRQKSVKNNEVVLIAQHMKPRIAKIGFALRRRNFRVVLFLEKENREELKKADKTFFNDIFFLMKRKNYI